MVCGVFRVISHQGPDVLGLAGDAIERLPQQDLTHPLLPVPENETGTKASSYHCVPPPCLCHLLCLLL